MQVLSCRSFAKGFFDSASTAGIRRHMTGRRDGLRRYFDSSCGVALRMRPDQKIQAEHASPCSHKAGGIRRSHIEARGV